MAKNKRKKEKKERPPRVFIDRRGDKFIRLKGKRYYLRPKPGISDRQLINIILNNFRKRNKRKNKKKKSVSKPGSYPQLTSTGAAMSNPQKPINAHVMDYVRFLQSLRPPIQEEIKGRIEEKKAAALPAPPQGPQIYLLDRPPVAGLITDSKSATSPPPPTPSRSSRDRDEVVIHFAGSPWKGTRAQFREGKAIIEEKKKAEEEKKRAEEEKKRAEEGKKKAEQGALTAAREVLRRKLNDAKIN